MELYFLRHGLAGQHGDPKYKDDSLRPLTAEGQEKMRRAAHGMLSLGLKFDAIISSPYLRAKQTAEIIAQAYKLKENKIYLTNNLLPPATAEELLQEISVSFPKSKNVLLVGHEPHLSEMISSLLNCNKSLDIDFKKGSLCNLSIAQDWKNSDAILNWLLTSTQLSLMSL